jgi:putative ABC transport system substrate-binding protein
MVARRRLVFGLTFGAGLGRRAIGQERPRIIGSLSPYTSVQAAPFRELFSRAMLDLHYDAGKHFVIVERLADGHNERLRELAEQLVKLRVDLIVASTTNAALAARDATSSIPIVFFDVSDTVRAGFVDSLGKPVET